MKKKHFKMISKIMLVTWMLTIIYMSHQSSPDVPMLFNNADKIYHFMAYFILSCLYSLSFSIKTKKDILIWGIFTFSFALSDEIHQYFIPNRFFDLKDLLFDLLGWFSVVSITKKNK